MIFYFFIFSLKLFYIIYLILAYVLFILLNNHNSDIIFIIFPWHLSSLFSVGFQLFFSDRFFLWNTSNRFIPFSDPHKKQ